MLSTLFAILSASVCDNSLVESFFFPNFCDYKNVINLWVSKNFRKLCDADINRGTKHDFPFINIHKVPREVLKTEGIALGFQPSQGSLRLLMNYKIMFDRYYCINSAKHCQNEENIGALYFITSSHFRHIIARTLLKTMHDSGPVQILIILHVLCMAPGNQSRTNVPINAHLTIAQV